MLKFHLTVECLGLGQDGDRIEDEGVVRHTSNKLLMYTSSQDGSCNVTNGTLTHTIPCHNLSVKFLRYLLWLQTALVLQLSESLCM